jgi:SNF2 family DNA or RNA helicase
MTKKKKGKLKLKIDELQTLFISKEYEQIVDFFKEFNQRSEYYNDISAHYDKNSIQYITLLESIVGEEYLQKNVDSYLDEDLLNEISSIKIENEYFKSRLRTYQVFGVQYLLNQKQVLLGDDMGLGKTVQALAVMSHLKSQDIDKFLVVVPLSVLINWEREINKHTHLISHILYSKDLKTNFKSWSISDLSDELEKAIQELDSNQNAKVQFYSRDSFGDLAKLKEFSISFSNENQYKSSLTKGHVQTEADLKKMIE